MNPIKTKNASLFITLLIALQFASFTTLAATNNKLPDLEGPVIDHTPMQEAVNAGDPITISAKVTDNVGVKTIILNYRLSGQQNYQQIEMKKLSTDLYSSTIPASQTPSSAVEYYIEAIDMSGNTVLRGLNFSPLKISINANQPAPASSTSIAQNSVDTKASQKKSSNNWIWWTIGAVVAGSATYALTRDSGDSGPTTGIIVINSPQPE